MILIAGLLNFVDNVNLADIEREKYMCEDIKGLLSFNIEANSYESEKYGYSIQAVLKDKVAAGGFMENPIREEFMDTVVMPNTTEITRFVADVGRMELDDDSVIEINLYKFHEGVDTREFEKVVSRLVEIGKIRTIYYGKNLAKEDTYKDSTEFYPYGLVLKFNHRADYVEFKGHAYNTFLVEKTKDLVEKSTTFVNKDKSEIFY